MITTALGLLSNGWIDTLPVKLLIVVSAMRKLPILALANALIEPPVINTFPELKFVEVSRVIFAVVLFKFYAYQEFTLPKLAVIFARPLI